jgi:hypothetical protein
MIYFDDIKANVHTGSRLGITSILVDDHLLCANALQKVAHEHMKGEIHTHTHTYTHTHTHTHTHTNTHSHTCTHTHTHHTSILFSLTLDSTNTGA